MVERSYTVDSIRQGDQSDTLIVRFEDKEFEYTFEIILPKDVFGKLAAFPGSVVKISLEKTG